jgi:hypothetical protein
MSGKQRNRNQRSKLEAYGECGNMVARDAAKALAMAKSIKRLVNTEIKCSELTASGTAITNSGVIKQLTALAQGDTSITRDGDSLRILKSTLRMVLVKNASATQTNVRIIVVRDRMNQGAAPAVTDILNTASPYFGIAIEQKNRDRFTFLYDKLFCINQLVASTTMAVQDVFHVNNPKHVHYSGVDATDASAGPGSVWLLAIANEATNEPSISYSFRMEFVDN